MLSGTLDLQSSLLTFGRADASIALLSLTSSLGVAVPVVDDVEHKVAGKGAVPCLRSAQGIDFVLRAGKLPKEVEGFHAQDEFPFPEGLTEGGVEDEVVGIEVEAAITATAVHGGIGREGESAYLCAAEGRSGVSGRETIFKVYGIQYIEVTHLPFRVTPTGIGQGADVQPLVVVLDVTCTVQGQVIDGIHMAFRIADQHGMVLGVVPVDAAVHVPGPVALLPNLAVGAEVGVGHVGAADVHGLVGIDAGGWIVGDRLRYDAMVIVELGIEVVHALARGRTVEVFGTERRPCGTLQVVVAEFDDEGMAVVAPVDAVEQFGRGVLIAGVKADVALAILPHVAERGVRVQDDGRLSGYGVNRPTPCPSLKGRGE